jgi:putative membrane protein insertion efficiency factor
MMTLLSKVLIAPIRWYQRWISPAFPPTCRFYPSCSAYAVRALEIHGPVIGLYLAIRRLVRCHPWTPGGIDQVPPKGQWSSTPTPYDPDEDPNSSNRTISDATSSETVTRSQPEKASATSLGRELRSTACAHPLTQGA